MYVWEETEKHTRDDEFHGGKGGGGGGGSTTFFFTVGLLPMGRIQGML